jgi:hypothetical protein
MIVRTTSTTAAMACITGLLVLAQPVEAEARGERIINGSEKNRADFSLEGQEARHVQSFEFEVAKPVDLHFIIACDDQSEMDVALRADELTEGATASDAPGHSVTSSKPIIFTFQATEAHVRSTRTWGLEIGSKWTMPVCTMSLTHAGRVLMFRSADGAGDSLSRAPDTDDTEDKWKDQPFVVFLAPREGS